jgi:hypothetical protein
MTPTGITDIVNRTASTPNPSFTAPFDVQAIYQP